MKIFLTSALLLLTASAVLADPLAPSVASRIAIYETWAEEQMVYRHQPGVVVGLFSAEGLVWGRGFGHADLERQTPVTPQTVFRIGSVTKLFTATAVLQLRDGGKLRLDDPVALHLPWFTYRDQFPEGPVITVRHLLTHTSGLPREAALPYWTDRKFPTRERLIEALTKQENVFEPGTRYKYSNLGLALLGEIVAAASGKSYPDFVTRNILEPLGMLSTRVRYQDVDPERLATGYLIRRDGSAPIAPATDSQALTPAADISSSLADLARFLAAHLSGSRPDAPFLALSTLRDMHRVQWLSSSWDSGRGFGFSVWRHGERTLVGHGGWVAGYRSQVAFDRQAGLGVIVLTNSDEGGPGIYLEQAIDFLVPALEQARGKSAVESSEPDGDLAGLAGSFHNPWGEVTDFFVVDGALTMYGRSYPPTSNLAGALTALVAQRELTFLRPGDGSQVTFELRADGRVARVKVGENYLFPEDCGEISDDLHCGPGSGDQSTP